MPTRQTLLAGTPDCRFAFYVGAVTLDANRNATGRDYAPDAGRWTYDLSAAATASPTTTTPIIASFWALKIGPPTTTPLKAVAGKPFAVKYPVKFMLRKSSQPVPGGKMVCDPSVAGKVIPHKESFKSGVARLSFVIPKTAKGKLLKVKVTITAADPVNEIQTTTRIATFRVK